jgi:hypothetical protein
VCTGYIKTLHHFYIMNLSILGFCYLRDILEPVLYRHQGTIIFGYHRFAEYLLCIGSAKCPGDKAVSVNQTLGFESGLSDTSVWWLTPKQVVLCCGCHMTPH